MNTQTLITMFLWSELEHNVAALESNSNCSIYEACGMGAIEVANSLEELSEEIRRKHCKDRQDEITDILYIHVPYYAVKLANFMDKHGFMPQSIYNLKE